MKKHLLKVLTFSALGITSLAVFANGDTYAQPVSYAVSGFAIGIDGGYGNFNSPEATYPDDYDGIYYPSDTQPIAYHHSQDVDIGDFVWGAHIGYDIKVRPDMVVGFEVGYKDLGNNKIHTTYTETTTGASLIDASRDYKQQAIDALLTARYYAYKGLNVFGKIGLAYVESNIDQEVSSNDPDFIQQITNFPLEALNGNNSIWRCEPEFSVGVGYTFNEHIDLHVAYTYIGGANDQELVNSSFSPSNTAAYQPKAKVYSTNMATLGLSYNF